MDITTHAISRLEDRFGYDKSHIKSILSILLNKRAYKIVTQKKDGSHYKFKYYGQYIVAVIKNNVIVTFKYTDKTYQNSQRGLTVGQQYTVKELSEQLKVPSRTIHNSIDRCFPNLKANGKTTYLNESQITEISKDLKRAHNVDLASTRKVATTDLELLDKSRDLMYQLTLRVKELNDENVLLKPKADLADTALRDESKQYSIRDSGKHLGLSQKEIFTLMRDKELLTIKNLPTQKALNYNVLSLKTNVVNGKNREQAVMTMTNIYEFRKRYLKGDKQ